MRSQNFILVIIVLSLWFAPYGVRAQDSATTATLTGFVRDSAGAGIPGATITLRHLTTNQTRNVSSEADGSYRATALAVGDYEIKAQAPVFIGKRFTFQLLIIASHGARPPGKVGGSAYFVQHEQDWDRGKIVANGQEVRKAG